MDLQIGKLSNIIINKEYDQAFDANDVLNIQGIRATSESTTNLPSEVSGDLYGILHTYLDKDGNGYQQYVPMNGSWANTVFKRRIKTSEMGPWQYILDSTEWSEELETEANYILDAINEIHNRVNGLITNDIMTSFPEEESSGTLTEELIDIWDNIKALQQGPDISDLAFGKFALIDNATEGCTSVGTLSTDLMASNGKAYSVTTTTTARNVFSANFSDIKFGKYSLCIRVRVSNNTSSSAILNMNIFNGSTSILSKNILGTNFDSNTKYCYICTTFNYEGSSSTAKQPLTFSLYSTSVSGITVYFDYAYISLLTPAVYI